MKVFTDLEGHRVELYNDETIEAKHCLAISKYNHQYLFTQHKKRGIEFPGGKVESGETIKGAIAREVLEETGGIVINLVYIGTYKVYTEDPFFKAVYKADIQEIKNKNNYLETYGPVLYESVEQIPMEKRSPLLQDDCVMYLYHNE